MSSSPTRAEQAQRWYLNDRPIDSVDSDRLGSVSVANTIVKAIESLDPPCMIGLLGGFGSGKSSVTRLASSIVDSSRFDPVTVSADKHSGSERARNLVHAVASKLVSSSRIKRADVDEILRPLRQATQRAVPDPSDTAWARMRSGRYSMKKWFKSMLPPFLIAAVLAVFGVLATGIVAQFGFGAAGLVVVGWPVSQLFSDWAAAVRGLNTAATHTDQMPRAEAADEIEEVFGNLVELHKKKKKGRRLVIFVDDIDRLSKDDLLDALRSLRSLQSVPRGSEPMFVISCDEAILHSAVKGSLLHPATASDEGVSADAISTLDANREPVPDQGGADGVRAARHDDFESGHDHPALAFVDKLLTVRVHMPPTMGGDMRRFAERVIDSEHPLRKELGDETLVRIVRILIHNAVTEPRSVIRLLNRFVAAYLLAQERERDASVAPGNATDHVDVLAQLCVLLDEYPRFHEEIASNPVLLHASHKVALRNATLQESDQDALRISTEFNDDSPFEFGRQSLRRYLSGTANRVVLPIDIGPLVYFTDTPGGRMLGAQLRSEITSGVESGDHFDLAGILDRVPADKIVDAAGEIEQQLHDASPVDASTLITAVAPNLSRLEDSAETVADACADLLDRAPEVSIPAPLLTEIISHTVVARDAMLCDRLVRPDGDTDDTNSRMVHAAEYLAGHPRIRRLVVPAIIEWVEGLPSEGSWGLAQTWLGVGEALDRDDYESLRGLIANSLIHSVRSEAGFSSDDADRLVRLAETCIKGKASASPRPATLVDEGPNTRSAFVRLWDITAPKGIAGHARISSEAAVDADIDPAVRQLAIRQTAAWVATWDDTDWGTETNETPDAIVANLATAAEDPRTLPAIAAALPDLAVGLGPTAAPLLSQATETAIELTDADRSTADSVASAILKAVAVTVGTEHEGEFDQYAIRLFDAIDSDNDPSHPAVQLAIRLIAEATRTEPGKTILGRQVRQWSNSLRGGGSQDNRARLDALRRAFETDPAIVSQHAQAQTILDHTTQQLDGGDLSPERFQTLTGFPWPDEQVEPALSVIDRHWDSLPEGADIEALEIVPRAGDEFGKLQAFHNRIAKIVLADPHGAVARIGAGETERMNLRTRALVFGSAVGNHDAVTSEWAKQSVDAAAEVIVDIAANADAVTRLLRALPDERAGGAAVLGLMVSTADVPEAAVKAVSAFWTQADMSQAAQAAVEALADTGPQASSALRVIISARENNADVDTGQLQERADSLLPEATTELAALFGRSLNGIRQRSDLKTTLNGLREDDSTAAIAGAFDAGRSA